MILHDLSMICGKTRPLFRRDNQAFTLLLGSNMLKWQITWRIGMAVFIGIHYSLERCKTEIEYMIQLLDDAYTTTLCHEEERQTRKLVWLPSKTKGFQVNSYYKQLRRSRRISFFFLDMEPNQGRALWTHP